MSFIANNPISSAKIETSPTPSEGTRGLFPSSDGWYDIDDNGNVKKILTNDKLEKVKLDLYSTCVAEKYTSPLAVPAVLFKGADIPASLPKGTKIEFMGYEGDYSGVLTEDISGMVANEEIAYHVMGETQLDPAYDDYVSGDTVTITLPGYRVHSYSKEETDAKLDAKADKAEVEAALDVKADKATTLAGYGITDAYTQEQMNIVLSNKADSWNVYTRAEVDDLVSNIDVDLSGYYTKLEVDTAIQTAIGDVLGGAS